MGIIQRHLDEGPKPGPPQRRGDESPGGLPVQVTRPGAGKGAQEDLLT